MGVWDSKLGNQTPRGEEGTEARRRKPHLNRNTAYCGAGYYFQIFTEHITHGIERYAIGTIRHGSVLRSAHTLDKKARMNQRAITPGHPLALEGSGLGAEQPSLKVPNGTIRLG